MLSKQLVAKRIGASGCYFLSIVYLCEKRTGKQIDIIALYDKALTSGWIESDCYMVKPADMIAYILGIDAKRVDVRHEVLNYKLKSNDYTLRKTRDRNNLRSFCLYKRRRGNLRPLRSKFYRY